jgi:hypothetical protein
MPAARTERTREDLQDLRDMYGPAAGEHVAQAQRRHFLCRQTLFHVKQYDVQC